WLRVKKARKIIVALPVAPLDVVSKIKPEVDHLIALETPKEFGSVGQFYEDFEQISDEEVMKLL
ncbi:MAG: phosphoribosyltransferase, partial [Patescibacteria group bacterium]